MNNISEIHNEPVLFCDRICMEQKFKNQNSDDVNNQQKQALKQLELKYDQKIKQLKDFGDKLQQYTQQILRKLNKIKFQVDQNIQQIIEQQQQVKNISIGFINLYSQIKINEQENILNDQQKQIKKQLINQLKDLEMITNINQLYYSFNNLQIDQSKKEMDQDENKKKLTIIESKLNYQFLQQSSYKQNEVCRAIAFYEDASIMVAGSHQLVKVFELKDDKIRELQQLNGHEESVCCLQFMKKSNQLISGSDDATMMI